jgi:3-hydroxyacyl-[acyl-carrier-protein] dehydratase
MTNNNSGLSPTEILAYVPQQKPFRFIDTVLSVDPTGIVGAYTFSAAEPFYAGHFPGHPVTPGVILLEAMSQTGVVAFGIYLLSLELDDPAGIRQWLTLFSDAQVEFLAPVYPDSRVIMTAEKIFWRHKKLKARVEMRDEQNTLLAVATVSGMGVAQS